jgi:prepilin-type N-terminal cleavage/methylation domain-containing protein
MQSRYARALRKVRTSRGTTLIELMIAVVIVGLLVGIGIPAFSEYKKRSYLSEATSNIQGILEAEQAFFVRFQRYTAALPLCPPPPAPPMGGKKLFDPTLCGGDWLNLGWTPDDSVAFQYRTYSAYNAAGARVFHPITALPAGMACPGGVCYGVNWNTEIAPNIAVMQPWLVVEATADTDKDTQWVFVRTNNINNKTFITPDKTY